MKTLNIFSALIGSAVALSSAFAAQLAAPTGAVPSYRLEYDEDPPPPADLESLLAAGGRSRV